MLSHVWALWKLHRTVRLIRSWLLLYNLNTLCDVRFGVSSHQKTCSLLQVHCQRCMHADCRGLERCKTQLISALLSSLPPECAEKAFKTQRFVLPPENPRCPKVNLSKPKFPTEASGPSTSPNPWISKWQSDFLKKGPKRQKTFGIRERFGCFFLLPCCLSRKKRPPTTVKTCENTVSEASTPQQAENEMLLDHLGRNGTWGGPAGSGDYCLILFAYKQKQEVVKCSDLILWVSVWKCLECFWIVVFLACPCSQKPITSLSERFTIGLPCNPASVALFPYGRWISSWNAMCPCFVCFFVDSMSIDIIAGECVFRGKNPSSGETKLALFKHWEYKDHVLERKSGPFRGMAISFEFNLK